MHGRSLLLPAVCVLAIGCSGGGDGGDLFPLDDLSDDPISGTTSGGGGVFDGLRDLSDAPPVASAAEASAALPQFEAEYVELARTVLEQINDVVGDIESGVQTSEDERTRRQDIDLYESLNSSCPITRDGLDAIVAIRCVSTSRPATLELRHPSFDGVTVEVTRLDVPQSSDSSFTNLTIREQVSSFAQFRIQADSSDAEDGAAVLTRLNMRLEYGLGANYACGATIDESDRAIMSSNPSECAAIFREGGEILRLLNGP